MEDRVLVIVKSLEKGIFDLYNIMFFFLCCIVLSVFVVWKYCSVEVNI